MLPMKEEQKPARTADPMSFSNILSSTSVEPPKTTPKAMPAAKQFQRASHTPNGDSGLTTVTRKFAGKKALSPNENGGSSRKSAKPKTHSPAAAKNPASNHKPGAIAMSDKENEKVKKEMERIDAMGLSDTESSAWAAEKEAFTTMSLKRQADVDAVEDTKRKVGYDT